MEKLSENNNENEFNKIFDLCNEKSYENMNFNDFNNCLNYFNVKDINHLELINNIKLISLFILINKENYSIDQNFKKIKFKSKLNVNNLDNILNLNEFKNDFNSNKNNTNVLLDKFKNSANDLKNKLNEKNNNNNNNNYNNNYNDNNNNNSNNYNNNNSLRNIYKNNNRSKNNSYNNNSSNSRIINNFDFSKGSYMDTKPIYKKNKSVDIEEEEDSTYSQYTNSIYNINKRKRKNKNSNYDYDDDDNNYNNKRRNYKKNNYYKRTIDEEEDENNDYDNQYLKKNTGFTSAITISNAVFKNNKISNKYIENLNNNQNENNNNINSNNINNNYNNNSRKNFVPPLKSNSVNKSKTSVSPIISNLDIPEEKKTLLEEKLKGFDEKMIEFIQSEILTSNPGVQWEDIAGLKNAKDTITEIIIWPMLRPDLFKGIRRPAKGLLLFGPPGTGKTMIAKAIASQSKSKFFNISASSLMSKWIGESEKLVRTLFALASVYQPSVVFIDEIDSLLTARSENENEASRRIKTEFLVQLDGAGTNADDNILIIGATNRPQEIDDAFVRRLNKRLYIPLPNKESRKEFIKRLIEKEQKENNNAYEVSDEDIDDIVLKTKGYSGSDLMNVCKEASMIPLRDIKDIHNVEVNSLRAVNKEDFLKSLNTVKPSVSEKTIGQYVEWNNNFGSFSVKENND